MSAQCSVTISPIKPISDSHEAEIVFTDLESALISLRSARTFFRKLHCTELPYENFPSVGLYNLLQDGLKTLVELEIGVQSPPANTPYAIGDICAMSFERLQTLRVSGFSMSTAAMHTSGFARLRRLELGRCYSRYSAFTLDGFLEAMDHWVSMEELKISNFLPCIDMTQPSVRQQQVTLPRLQSFVLEDNGDNIQLLLSHMFFPSTTEVAVVEFRDRFPNDAEEAFAILPDLSVLPVISEVTDAVVDVYTSFIVSGHAHHGGSLHFEVRAADYTESDLSRLFNSAIHHLPDLFTTSDPDTIERPMEQLTFRGIVEHVPPHTWLETFQAFLHVTRVNVHDTEMGDVRSLLWALDREASDNMSGVLQGLDTLTLKGPALTSQLLDVIHNTLKTRRESEQMLVDVNFVFCLRDVQDSDMLPYVQVFVNEIGQYVVGEPNVKVV